MKFASHLSHLNQSPITQRDRLAAYRGAVEPEIKASMIRGLIRSRLTSQSAMDANDEDQISISTAFFYGFIAGVVGTCLALIGTWLAMG
jgi:hypothetical protein